MNLRRKTKPPYLKRNPPMNSSRKRPKLLNWKRKPPMNSREKTKPPSQRRNPPMNSSRKAPSLQI